MKYLSIFFFILTISQSGKTQFCSNTAMSFDGINDDLVLTSIGCYNHFTITAWFNSSSIPVGGAEDRIFSVNGPRLEVGLENDLSREGQIWVHDQSAGHLKSYGSNLQDDSWHQVAFVKKGMERSLYLDGAHIDTWVSTDICYGGTEFRVANWPGGGSVSHFKGMIDEVAFYDKPFNASGIQGMYNCNLTGLEEGLVLFYNFEDGIGGDDNTSLTTVQDMSPNGNDATIRNMALVGDNSNYVCSEVCPLECTMECTTNTIDLSTGLDDNGSSIPIGMYSGSWQLIGAPPGSVSLVGGSLPSYVLSTPGAWHDLPGAQYISPFAYPHSTYNNFASNTSFDFANQFCVCEDQSSVTISLAAFSDNNVDIDLYTEDGTKVTDLLEITDTSPNAFKNPSTNATQTLILPSGRYSIIAKLKNDGSTYTGLAIRAILTGAGLLESACCRSYNSLLGSVYNDLNCNGINDGTQDDPLVGWTVELCNSAGSTITTTVTDNFGLYSFSIIPADDYIIKVVNTDPDYILTDAPNVPVTIGANDVIGSLDFGYNYVGPITTSPISTSCAQPGSVVDFDWLGQECDCTIEILYKPCDTDVPYQVLDIVGNNGNYRWQIPAGWSGDYHFLLKDCDGNMIPIAGCLGILDLDFNLTSEQVDCGTYQFDVAIDVGLSGAITSVSWDFGDGAISSSASPIHGYTTAGTYQVCARIVTANGCRLRECISLDVFQGTEDDCDFCPPNVQSEIEDGDLYIHDGCYGVIIQSPNGSCFRIQVTDDGQLISQPVECPGTTTISAR